MWKNIFIESSILSLLIFGGFYMNAHFQKEKITASEEKVRLQQDSSPAVHISGMASPGKVVRPSQHVSGGITVEEPGKGNQREVEHPAIGRR
jgi:hypothetical protein